MHAKVYVPKNVVVNNLVTKRQALIDEKSEMEAELATIKSSTLTLPGSSKESMLVNSIAAHGYDIEALQERIDLVSANNGELIEVEVGL